MEQIIQEILEYKNVRSNMSELRKRLKDGADAQACWEFVEANEELFRRLLAHEDAKTRKNTALLLGDLSYQELAADLVRAYEHETTMFVRSAYLEALSNMEIDEFQTQLQSANEKLLSMEITEENRKHIDAEKRAMHRLMNQFESGTHRFEVHGSGHEVLLTVVREQRETLRRMVGSGAKVHPLGVYVRTDDLLALSQIRTYRRILFPMGENTFVSENPNKAAAELAPWMEHMHDKYLSGEGSVRFRIDVRGLELAERGKFAKRLGSQLEQLTGNTFMNLPEDYEVELLLTPRKDGRYFPCLAFSAFADKRFRYRKHAISASIQPSTAALIMELAKPYLKENAQILDPFCGVGTMLVERDIAVPAADKYGTDIFGDAIVYGRENAKAAGVGVNFIHRDFFDFKHDYKFDEIVTNMPYRGRKTKEEMELLYTRFFTKALTLLAEDAVIVMYTNEIGFVKKQLRLHPEYRLLQETCMQNKTNFYLFVIGVKH